MNQTIKLPNGKDYEVKDAEKDYLHVFITHKHGVALSSPYVAKFHQRTWKNMDEKNMLIAGETVWSPEIAEKIAEEEAKAAEKKAKAEAKKKEEEEAAKKAAEEEVKQEAEAKTKSAPKPKADETTGKAG